eukprot:1499733-Pyramimonas_sp.AAC.1
MEREWGHEAVRRGRGLFAAPRERDANGCAHLPWSLSGDCGCRAAPPVPVGRAVEGPLIGLAF